MGNSSSSGGVQPPPPVDTDAVTSLSEADETKKLFDEFRPSAAVVGGSVAGVHAAMELADAGFRVTLIERADAVPGSVATHLSKPLVGFAYDGTVHEIAFGKVLVQKLLPGSRPYLTVSRLRDFVDTNLFRWLRASRRSKSTAKFVSEHANALSADSALVVRRLVMEEPEMRDAVIADPAPANTAVTPEEAPSSSGVGGWKALPWARSDTAPLIVDPGKWAKKLAEVAARKHGVELLTGTAVTHVEVKFRFGSEKATGIAIKNSETGITSARQFDLVVLASGAALQHQKEFPTPLLRVVGKALSFPGDHSQLAQLVPPNGGWLASLHSSGPISVFPLPSSLNKPAANGEKSWCLHGLARTSTVTAGEVNVDEVLSQFTSRLALRGISLGALGIEDSDKKSQRLEAVSFNRSFTPDGLPYIGHLGPVDNVFVCDGFGDEGMAWGPASAFWLRRLVLRQVAEEDNPFSLARDGICVQNTTRLVENREKILREPTANMKMKFEDLLMSITTKAPQHVASFVAPYVHSSHKVPHFVTQFVDSILEERPPPEVEEQMWRAIPLHKLNPIRRRTDNSESISQ